MQRLVLLLFLCGVRGQWDDTPDVLSLVTKLQTQIQNLETQVQALQSSQTQSPTAVYVAFSAGFDAGLGDGTIASPTRATPIKYSKVLTNIGNAFNANTGVFTAPLKGLYVFHLSMYAVVIHPVFAGPVLKRNTEALAEPMQMHTANGKYPVTRVVVVTLEAGDTVYVELPAQTSISASLFNEVNGFSGFLIAPM